VGNHRDFDYDKPRSIGMSAILIDRSGKETGPDVIHDLRDLTKRL
jgi:FMN phosphatase YigB (HAD superfamily)